MKMKKGFSLVEIGIVLVIIGILIAAVMKGKDVITGAEVKQHSQTFLNKWVNIATTHYDKLGYNITGSSTNSSMTVADGRADANASTVHGCTDIKAFAKTAGIDVDSMIISNVGSPCRKKITGEFTGESTVGVGFENLTITTQEVNSSKKNVVLFFNVPGDVALAFDKLVDGIADSNSGKVVLLQSSTSESATQIGDDNLSTNTSGITAISGDINATDYHTVGVIMEH